MTCAQMSLSWETMQEAFQEDEGDPELEEDMK